ncbi:hypothetical protein P4N68_04110 [Corynebacterium felinum]|uniref:Uncharacterized protein n=1 Tax=Corynebacterium felinum TaxID=131318 RepID=A0ABU2B9G0_9CORY|nr:hypothetical protein [Corynebacterium felinum]MDF5820270.1 hypothetical protein [Corynebacterium felinum]MDR7355026.1 hypothetical protein [Corynebacterium felinum]WJY94379.1 hypothetical protein CFELI_03725 [Corynebacterium felinum]
MLSKWIAGDRVFSCNVEPDATIVANGLYLQQHEGESNDMDAPAFLTRIIKDWVPVING